LSSASERVSEIVNTAMLSGTKALDSSMDMFYTPPPKVLQAWTVPC
jgi:hypothetical protein